MPFQFAFGCKATDLLENPVDGIGVSEKFGEWASLMANDPDTLFTMRASYRRVSGAATDEDQEILAEFNFDQNS